MFDRVHVVGAGRAGSAITARLAERGVSGGPLDPGGDQARALVLLCIPDDQIDRVAEEVAEGPWIAHVSGATPLAALSPHRRRFGVHPLQTLVRGRGPEQLDGAWGAVTADDEPGRERGWWLARTLGLVPFDLADDRRVLYHAGAAMASNFLVTLHDAAASLLSSAGVPRDALLPLMRRTIDNGFELTGPIARGDRGTIDRHVRALREETPDLVPLYQALAEATRP
jgi:predicted short-subunit dehydrogenase-like oxidoreductase (DUF2520 family)